MGGDGDWRLEIGDGELQLEMEIVDAGRRWGLEMGDGRLEMGIGDGR